MGLKIATGMDRISDHQSCSRNIVKSCAWRVRVTMNPGWSWPRAEVGDVVHRLPWVRRQRVFVAGKIRVVGVVEAAHENDVTWFVPF